MPRLLTEPGGRARSAPDERSRPRDAGRCRCVARPPLRGDSGGSAGTGRAADAALAPARRDGAVSGGAACLRDHSAARKDRSRAREGGRTAFTRRSCGRGCSACCVRAESARAASGCGSPVHVSARGSGARRGRTWCGTRSDATTTATHGERSDAGGPAARCSSPEPGRCGACTASGACSSACSVGLAFRGAVCQAPPPPGAVAQLGERMTGSHEVRGSIPLGSTNFDGSAHRA
jgi:hypothetical protein